MPSVWTRGLSYFVALRGDHDDHLEGLSHGKGHSADLLLRAPGVILKGVENHFVPPVKSGVHVHGDVTGLRHVAAQVDDKPAGEKKNATRVGDTM